MAEAILAERAAIRAAVTSAMAAPGTGPESAEVIQVLERLRAGESPVAIARQTGALRERGPGPHPTRDGGCAGMTGPAAGSAPEPAAETWTYGGIRATGAGLDLSGINSM
jgi:hypothetical protein